MGETFNNDGPDAGNLSGSTESARTGPAWENRQGIGTFGALVGTVKSSMLGPTAFFREMRRSDGLVDPLVYAIILGSLSMILSMAWELLIFSAGRPIFEAASYGELTSFKPVYYGLTAILSPIVVTLQVFLYAALLHVALLILGGARQGFQTSFRVVCYSHGTGVCSVLPSALGTLVGGVWNLVLLVIGLTESHEIPVWRSILAVLMLLVVLLLVVVALGLLVITSGGLLQSL